MTYHVAVSRCSACRGRGSVKLPYQIPSSTDYAAYKQLLDEVGVVLAIQRPCR